MTKYHGINYMAVLGQPWVSQLVGRWRLSFLRQSKRHEAQVKNASNSLWLCLYFRGEWMQALEYFRVQVSELRKKGSFQEIAGKNTALVDTILELHRFAGLDDLADYYLKEAETALRENIAIHWYVLESHLKLAILSARKGLLQEARVHLEEALQLDEALQPSDQRFTQEGKSHQLHAEAEIALAEGDWEKAITAYQTLIDIYQAAEYRMEWARWLIDLGDVLLKRDGPGDREKAREAFLQSLEIFTELEAPGYIQVLEERLRN
jgi:tetratricopeptide (TPR) repeat protein